MSRPTPRDLHYAEFYGLADDDDGRPVAWVHGNCQAESLRVQLEGPELRTVRVPPVHELVADDLPHLERLVARTDVWVSQPVREGYRDLPVGLPTLSAAMSGARIARVPLIRFAEHVLPVERQLLDHVHAPRSAVAVEALGLDGSEIRDDWLVNGEPVRAEAVRETHLAWYADHPDAVAAGLERHRDTLALLGLAA